MCNEHFKQSEDYWFDDGNIILVAGGTGFRLHKGILSRHSVVFGDMFSFPQSADSSEQFDGCPVVYMTDDPLDLGHILSVLYDGGEM